MKHTVRSHISASSATEWYFVSVVAHIGKGEVAGREEREQQKEGKKG